MSWLNNSFNSLKGQINALAQEVLAPDEEANPGSITDTKTALELLSSTQKEKEDLYSLCSAQEGELALLRKKIAELENQKISDTGGGSSAGATTASGRTSKSPTTGNAILEDSWCWEPDNVKREHDHSSESSSGNGSEMVNITLEEIPLGKAEKSSKKAPRPDLQRRIHQLEEENKQLNSSLDELDSQHGLAMQNMLELKTSLQEKLSKVTKDYEVLKKEQADKFINSELEIGKLKNQLQKLQQEHQIAEERNRELQTKTENYSEELKNSIEEMADLQALLEKKNQDNMELIDKVKLANTTAEQFAEERQHLLQRVEQISKELDEVKQSKEKKTSESSTSSNSKHSEDEFIVVREGDGNSSGPATPPSKEALKDRIVELENRVSELTLENGSLALKVQDREMEKELSAQVLKQNLQLLQDNFNKQEEKLQVATQQLVEQEEKLHDFREKASEAIIAQEKLKKITEDKTQIETEIAKLKQSTNKNDELEKRLLFSEQEKEQLQLELQDLRTSQDRIKELESKMQTLILENQQLKLNVEAEAESLNNSLELEDKLKSLSEENDSLRADLESMAQTKFRQAIAEEKQEITDLDAEDEEPFTVEKLRDLVNAYAKNSLPDLEEALERAYRCVGERMRKIEALEKNMAHLMEEVMDLRDAKLVWIHDKKTLEADISQYVLQCDEFMKNNEILLNELENAKHVKLETIPEHNEENVVQLENQLEECTKLNRTLEQEYAELNDKIAMLEGENQALTNKLRAAQECNNELKVYEKKYKLHLESSEVEKSNLLFELNELKSTQENDDNGNVELEAAEEKCQDLESQLARLSRDHADLVAALQAQSNQLLEANRKHSEYEKEIENLNTKLKTIEEKKNQRELELLGERTQKLAFKENEQFLQTRLEELENQYADLYESRRNENEKLIEDLEKELQTTTVQLNDITTKLITTERQYQELEKMHLTQTKKLESLHNTYEKSIENAPEANTLTERIALLEHELESMGEIRSSLESVTAEKAGLMNALQQKHSENMQYYMEIQRLQGLANQLEEEKRILQGKACEKCATLEVVISDLRKEQEKLQDQINFLKEKSDILTTNLLTEQTNQKLMQQEKAEAEEQNVTLRKDLERLRAHLLEIEDMHTQETVDMQRELEETKSKMLVLQEEVSKSSNAYTSASIRANQHAETLQAQYALVIQQRDDLVNKLSLVEDRELKNQAALTNLQCALEQFQNDKENDIKAATQRIRKELQQELNKEAQLQEEINLLNQQLADANEGLRAAARLSDQLECCQQTIAALREEVETIKQQNSALEAKLSSSESSHTDKIDKTLIKSLLIGYVVSGNPNDKNQVLRMISSVLDFSQTESDKVGLNKQQTSWLGSILGGTSPSGAAQGTHSNENLVQAFVQFLEQESQPKTSPSNMPNLLNITQTNPTPHTQTAADGASNTPHSRRSSVASNSGANAPPLPIQPLQLSSTVLNEFAPTRNSSSILKDILSDS